MEIVLYQPQIPQNVGSIARTCAVTGSKLILVGPLGFSLSERQLRRAGLDYWEDLQVEVVDSLEKLLAEAKGQAWFLSSKGKKLYTDIAYGKDDLLIFGSETTGLPAWVHERHQEQLVTIHMIPGKRCLNLAISTGICLYEAWRQQGFR